MKNLTSTICLTIAVFFGSAGMAYELPPCQSLYHNCFGSLNFTHWTYVGEFQEGRQHGKGTKTFDDGRKYVGEFSRNDFHGKGTLTYGNGDKYVGDFSEDEPHGQGVFTFADGRMLEGIWKNGVFKYAQKVSPLEIANFQNMRPLAEAAKNAAAPYAAARCAGLYQALMERIGYDRMGDESWSTINTAREGLIILSARIAQDASGGTLEHQVGLAVRDVRNIADLYLARMDANYASSGQAYGDDNVIQADLLMCKSIAELLN